MTGYDYELGMSNNAVDAYTRGVKPLSRITAQDLKLAGWEKTKNEALALGKTGFWRPAEWHHSGGTWFNRVDFYDPADLVDAWENATDAEKTAALELTQPKEKTAEQRVRGSFTIWGGTRRRPRPIGEQVFVGTLRGDWIFLDGGGKKSAKGRSITWQYV